MMSGALRKLAFLRKRADTWRRDRASQMRLEAPGRCIALTLMSNFSMMLTMPRSKIMEDLFLVVSLFKLLTTAVLSECTQTSLFLRREPNIPKRANKG